jgi:lantibiotic biosynthesis protein
MHNLCGYSHGAAGVGHALLELYAAKSDDRYRAAAESAFAYEQTWFDHAGTWPDLRGVARVTGYQAPAPPAGSWCHGAPGIALSRLRAQRILAEPREDAATATALTKDIACGLLQREPDDFSLCHGAAGIADVLLYAAPDDADARDLGLLGIEIQAARGFPTGIPASPTPGLFLGLAGIGLLYLRLADPTLATPLIVHLDSAGKPSVESAIDPEAR